MNDLYKYLGMFIVGLFFLFIMFNGFRVQNIMLSSLVTGDIDNKETFENINSKAITIALIKLDLVSLNPPPKLLKVSTK